MSNFGHKDIPGWGVDCNPKDLPSYPLVQEYDNTKGIKWNRPHQQPEEVEVLMSLERPIPSAVIGTSVPPRGLSGAIRRFAFKYSEDKYRHWVPLILADRINVVEGIFSDLFHGKIPNIPAELGARSEYKYNKKGFYKKTIGTILVFALAIYLIIQ